MNVDDLIRAGLHDIAEEVTPYPGLYADAVRRGRRHRAVRRTVTASSAVLSVAAIAAGAVLLSGGGGTQTVSPSDSTQQVVTSPWWQLWPLGRHNGAVDPHFLAAIDPDNAMNVQVYAAGTTTDGTQWAMYTDAADGHRVAWMDGRDGQPLVGDVPDEVDPNLTWTSWSFPTQSAEDGTSGNQQWLIVVGRPGTTQIDFSADGTNWQPLETHDGIADVFLSSGFPPATAEVRLSDASGVYAVGTPTGAGAGQPDASARPTPGGDAPTPTATPTNAIGSTGASTAAGSPLS